MNFVYESRDYTSVYPFLLVEGDFPGGFAEGVDEEGDNAHDDKAKGKEKFVEEEIADVKLGGGNENEEEGEKGRTHA